MSNKSLFSSSLHAVLSRLVPKADAVNNAGGLAYALSPKQALAQLAATGCLNSTFYASSEDQLKAIVELAADCEPEFVGRVALYARAKGHMKDTPALLLAVLSVTGPGVMAEVFDRVIDSPKMLRNFVQIMRSGAVGRRSLGTLPKRLVAQWIDSRSCDQLFRASLGNDPSLADVIRLSHPKPKDAQRAALYAYLLGEAHDESALPELVRTFERFKRDPGAFAPGELPEVPIDMLTSLELRPIQWKTLAKRASWQTLRMNLNTFSRHGVFEDESIVGHAVSKLRDASEIAKARVFPYQLMAAYVNASPEIPRPLTEALQDAMELALANVPRLDGNVWVLTDVSGSMRSPVTGHRKGATSKVTCLDVAALISAAILRQNPQAGVIPFSDAVVALTLNARDSVMTSAQRLAAVPSGGTNCSAPLAELNRRKAKADVVIFVSDNESWVDSMGRQGLSRGTKTMVEWEVLKRRNPDAKLVCIDLQPGTTTQAQSRNDVLNVGGFSDSVFSVIESFVSQSGSPDHWVSQIEKESL